MPWGSPSAFNNAIIGGQQIDMNEMAMQEHAVKLDSDKLALERQQAEFQNINRYMAQHDPATSADYWDNVAMMHVMTNPNQASQIANRASRMRRDAVLMEETQLKRSSADVKSAVEILSNVHDASSWEDAKLAAMAEGLDRDPHVAALLSIGYDAPLVDKLRESLTTDLQKANARLSILRGNKINQDMQDDKFNVAYTKALTREAEARTTRLQKLAGAMGTTRPKPSDVALAKQFITADFPSLGLNDDGFIGISAEQVAEDATTMMKQNSALTPNQAVRKAYENYKPNIAPRMGHSANLNMPGQVKDKPATLPKTWDGSEQGLRKVPNGFYTFPNGVYAVVDGQLYNPDDIKNPGDLDPPSEQDNSELESRVSDLESQMDEDNE